MTKKYGLIVRTSYFFEPLGLERICLAYFGGGGRGSLRET